MADNPFQKFIRARAGNPDWLPDRIKTLETVDEFFDLVSLLYNEYEKPKTETRVTTKKRPKTARAFFQEDKSEEVKTANPEFTPTEIRAEISRMWREDFSEKDSRAEWQEKADAAKTESSPASSPSKADKEEAPEKKVATKKSSEKKAVAKKSPVPKGKQVGRRSEHTEYVPKKAQSAYMFMCDAHRSAVTTRVGGLSTDVTKELRRMWKEDFATKESRAEYQTLADQDKARFLTETQAVNPPKTSAPPSSSSSPPSSSSPSLNKRGIMSTEKGNKIWSVTVEGCNVTCSWGKEGGSQQSRVVTLGDPEKAVAEAQKRFEKKEKEGYSFDESTEQTDESTVVSAAQKKKAKTRFRKNLAATLHEEQPGLSKSEISTVLAQSWDALSDEEILAILEE